MGSKKKKINKLSGLFKSNLIKICVCICAFKGIKMAFYFYDLKVFILRLLIEKFVDVTKLKT